MDDVLPPDILQGATLRGKGSTVGASPHSLKLWRGPEAGGYACLGGQFQFRLQPAPSARCTGWRQILTSGLTRNLGWIILIVRARRF